MQVHEVDVAVIGAGTAGLNAWRQVEKDGRTALLIESGPYGTLCARIGCMPSKLLIAAADAAHEVAGAGRFGIRVPDGVVVDGPAVFETRQLEVIRQELDEEHRRRHVPPSRASEAKSPSHVSSKIRT